MTTPVFVCGAECGVTAIGTAALSTNGRHVSTLGATTTIQNGGGKTRGSWSLFSWKFNPSNATTDTWAHLFPAAIASPSTTVVRFAIMFDVLPNAIHTICSNQGGLNGIRYNPTGTKLEAWAGSATATFAGSFVPSTGVWYVIDVKMVRDTTHTTDWQVDGVAQTQASKGTQTAATTTGINFGHNGTGSGGSLASTHTFYIDDIVVSGTSANYPFGDGHTYGIYPDGDGTHSFTNNDFAAPTAANAKLNTATDIWTALKQGTGGGTDGVGLNSTIGEFVSQIVIRTTGYTEYTFAALGSSAPIHGLELISAHHGSTTGAHTQSLRLEDGATENVILALVDASDVTISYNSKCYAVAPSTSGAWSKTLVDALKARWGYSGDVTGNPIFDGIVLEVDVSEHLIAPTGPTVTITAGTPALALSVTPTGPTVTVTAGTGTVTQTAPDQNVSPTGPTVSVSAGTPVLDLAITFTGPTVTVTPGTGLVAPDQAVSPVGLTVTVTAGTPALALTISPDGPTVAVTAGTATVIADQAVSPAGPTVSVSPGTPAVALTITPDGPTVAVTAGTPALALALDATGPTVAVTPGTPELGLSVAPTGPTVSITAGTPELGLAVSPTGPTVTVTAGTATVVPASGQQTITPDGPTVTVTSGTLALALTVDPTGPTVTIAAGTPELGLAVSPTGPTVSVAAGIATVAAASGQQDITVDGPTVTVTPGTATVALFTQTIVATGPTVAVTTGTATVALFDQTITATGPTVTVTAGVPTVVLAVAPPVALGLSILSARPVGASTLSSTGRVPVLVSSDAATAQMEAETVGGSSVSARPRGSIQPTAR